MKALIAACALHWLTAPLQGFPLEHTSVKRTAQVRQGMSCCARTVSPVSQRKSGRLHKLTLHNRLAGQPCFCGPDPRRVLSRSLTVSAQHAVLPPLASSLLAGCCSPPGDPDGAGGGQFLTLRRLVPWLSEPLRRMRLLAALGDAAEGLEGGELATVVYEYTRHGDPFVAAAASKLLQQVGYH